jgi:hypothetical protein
MPVEDLWVCSYIVAVVGAVVGAVAAVVGVHVHAMRLTSRYILEVYSHAHESRALSVVCALLYWRPMGARAAPGAARVRLPAL